MAVHETQTDLRVAIKLKLQVDDLEIKIQEIDDRLRKHLEI